MQQPQPQPCLFSSPSVGAMGVFDFEIFALETGTHESQSRGNKWAFEVDAFYAPSPLLSSFPLANQLGSVLCGFPEKLQCGAERIS